MSTIGLGKEKIDTCSVISIQLFVHPVNVLTWQYQEVIDARPNNVVPPSDCRKTDRRYFSNLRVVRMRFSPDPANDSTDSPRS